VVYFALQVLNLLCNLHNQPLSAAPKDWLEPLELREVITELAEDLYAFREWEIGEYSGNKEMNERIWRKYPGF